MLAYERSFVGLADAQTFFTNNLIDLGFQPRGPANFQIVFSLTGSEMASGFEFNYAFGAAAVPAP
jgi:hypothetical protein